MNDQQTQNTSNLNDSNFPEELLKQIENTSEELNSNSKVENEDLNNSEEIQKLKEELELAKSQKLRALADCDNLRKRFEIDLNNAKSRGNSVILSKLLEFSEDFARMLENAKEENDIEKLRTNVNLISEKLSQFLKNQDIIELDVKVGDNFDEESMEAVGVVQSEKDNSVQLVAQKGYKVQSSGIILRATRVIVGKSDMN